MKYIQFNPKTFEVNVTDAPQRDGVNIHVTNPHFKENPFNARIRVSSLIYEHVLYPAMEAADKRQGKRIEYSLVPPDPWLVALGLVMWEGIVQGFAWDAVKMSVNAALKTLRGKGVAPLSEEHEVTERESREFGFAWTNYQNGKKPIPHVSWSQEGLYARNEEHEAKVTRFSQTEIKIYKMSTPTALVQKLWNYCNILRDDGLSYGDYVEQLTFLLFLKMADEQSRPPFNKPSPIPKGKDWPALLVADKRRLSVVEELESVVSANLQRASSLRQSILQRAFSGQL